MDKAAAAGYSQRILESEAPPRIRLLIDATHDSMRAVNEKMDDMGSVLNDETRGLPVIVRKAMAERQKLARVPVGIWQGQLFAGCFTLREEKRVCTYTLPEFAAPEEIARGEAHGFGVYSMFGHISPNYPRLLTLGARGVRAMAEERLEAAREEINRDFLQAVIISLEGLEDFAARHVAMLNEKIAREADAARRAELARTRDALARCPREPASTFFEACQSVWLLHLALQLTGNYLALGRPDQYLYPYLERDIDSGALSLDQAQEIADCFMLKFNERSQDNEVAAQMMDLEREQQKQEKKWAERRIYDIGQQRYNVRDTVDAINHWNQNVVIGGLVPETGEDAANLLTVMLLESFRRMRLTNPVLSVRLHEGTPDFLLRQVAVTLRTGGGLPALYNDHAVIGGYTRFGVDEKDARDYANNGCWECILPGKTDFYFIKMNALKCMEWALNHGRCHVDNRQEAPDMGGVEQIACFDDLYARVLSNFRFVMETCAKHMIETQHLRSIVAPVPLLSALLEGPIEKGLDMTQMGARYVIGGVIAEGISHVIDSLCAIDQMVYQKKACDLKTIVRAIDANFVGFEKLRVRLAACPKYGANDPIADAIGIRLTRDYSQIMKDIDDKNPEMKFLPGIGTFSWYIAVGNGTGASADGRFMAEPVASNFSPSANAMQKGILGAMQSFAKMSQDALPLGSPLDIGMPLRYVEGDEGAARLTGLLKTFVRMGGNLMTICVADTQTLLDAQREPEKHRDLRVRMGGWSAYFTMLSREQQDYHIQKSRTTL